MTIWSRSADILNSTKTSNTELCRLPAQLLKRIKEDEYETNPFYIMYIAACQYDGEGDERLCQHEEGRAAKSTLYRQ